MRFLNWSIALSVALLSNTSCVVATDDYTFNQLGQDMDGEAAHDWSGWSVALSNDGKTVGIGAYGNDDNGSNSGHARVYGFDAGSSLWVQKGNDIEGENWGDQAGFDIDLSADGNIIAVGARCNDDGAYCGGHVRVYEYDGSIWSQLGGDLDGDNYYEYFGSSLALSADGKLLASAGRNYVQVHKYDAGTGWSMLGQEISKSYGYENALVSLSQDGRVLAIGERSSNRARVFEYDDGSGSWIQMGSTLTGSYGFGTAVSISSDGSFLAVGAYYDSTDYTYKGSVSVFEYNGAAWNAVGSPMYGDQTWEYFGWALEISNDGQRVAVGAMLYCVNTGRVGLYEYDGVGSWVQLGEDLIGEAYHDYSGRAVGLSGDGTILASGAYLHDGVNGTNSGHVRVYESVIGSPPTPPVVPNDYTFFQMGDDIEGEAAHDLSGNSIALSNEGTTVAIGAYYNDGNYGYDRGHARVYKYYDSSWVQIGQDIDGENYGDNSGFDIDLSSDGSIVAVGARYNDGGAWNGGHVRVFEYNGNIDMWEQLGGDLDGDNWYDYFGYSLALSSDGKVLASAGRYYAQVHKYDAGTGWTLLGQEIARSGSYSESMLSLSSDGVVLALGEPSYYRVRVFQYVAGTGWTQMGPTVTGPIYYNFGRAVSLSGDGTILGVSNYYDQTGHGAVYVYQYDGSTWNSLGSPLHGDRIYDYFGYSLDLSSDGQRIAVGVRDGHYNCTDYVGIVRLFEYDGNDGDWFQVGHDIGGEARYDHSGHSVALSGDGNVIASGSIYNDGVNGTNTGHVRVYDSRGTGGASGDPHFKTWSGESYDFHGLCDLILLQNLNFNSGLGMDIHIRTKKMKEWSFISNAVLRIGEDILEIRGDPNGESVGYWINGIEGDEKELTNNAVLPHSISGFPIFYRKTSSKQHEFTVDLGNNEMIEVKTWKELVRVDIHRATKLNFGESLGLMGTFGKGKHMARDGRTVLTDVNEFGQEWQVLSSEPTLFHSREGPQAPEKCAVPTSTKLRRRLTENVISQEQAVIACARVDEADRAMCIFDVMATNDMEVVGAY